MGSRRPIPPSSRTPERPQGQPGLVLAHFGQASLVENENGEVFRCATRRNLPRTVCGDRVFWQASNPREGVILRVLERATTLIRPDKHGRIRPIAANLDQIVVMIACKPSFEYGMLDRYLVAAELIGTVPVVVVNKSDLLDFQSRTKLEPRLAIYEQIGYSLLFISTRTTDGLTAMHEHFKSHTSILVGQSGVGKSSLVQVLLPDLDIRTGALSQFTGLGRHTTTVTTLYHLPEGGALIDSGATKLGGRIPARLSGRARRAWWASLRWKLQRQQLPGSGQQTLVVSSASTRRNSSSRSASVRNS